MLSVKQRRKGTDGWCYKRKEACCGVQHEQTVKIWKGLFYAFSSSQSVSKIIYYIFKLSYQLLKLAVAIKRIKKRVHRGCWAGGRRASLE
jgi:hypothetical protein